MADDSIPMILQGEAAAVDVGCTQNIVLKDSEYQKVALQELALYL